LRCDDAKWRLLLYLDGDLGDADRDELEAHLAECEECRAELERVRATERAVDVALGEVEAGDTEALRRIRSGVTRARRLRAGTRPAVRLRTTVLLGAAVILGALVLVTVPTLLGPLYAAHRQLELQWPGTAADDGALAVRVRCTDVSTDGPLVREPVSLSLTLSGRRAHGPVSVATGFTDASGYFHGVLRAPAAVEPMDVVLEVRAGDGIGATEAERGLRIVPRRRAFLWIDRAPVAPGDAFTVAGLVLHRASSRPARDEEVRLSILAADGTPYLIRTARTDDSGHVRASASLPSDLPAGTYRAVLEHDLVRREYPFHAERRRGSDIDVALSVEPSPAAPGDSVRVTAVGRLPSGAPAVGASAQLATGLGRTAQRLRQARSSDSEGRATAWLTAPTGGDAGTLDVSARFEGPHLEEGRGAMRAPLLGRSLRLLAVPQGGVLVPGRNGVIEVFVFDDLGLPAPARLSGSLRGSPVALATGPDGVAELWAGTVTPDSRVDLRLSATDDRGRYGTLRLSFTPAEPGSLVAVPDRGLARPGETLSIDLYSDVDGLALVDLLRDGQPVSGTAVELRGGEARLYVPVDATMAGTVGICARWPGQPVPGTVPAVLIDPTRRLTLSWSNSPSEPGENRASIRVGQAGGRWQGRVFGALTPTDRSAAPPDVHPALDYLCLSLRALDIVRQRDLDRLALSWVRGDRPSQVRRPSRVFLTAAGVNAADPQVTVDGPPLQQSQMRARQVRVFRASAASLALLFGIVFVGLLIGGRLRVRGALGVGEEEAAADYVRRLRTDMVLCGLAIALAVVGAVWPHQELAYPQSPSGPALPDGAREEAPVSPSNGMLVAPISQVTAHLPAATASPRSVDDAGEDPTLIVRMPERASDFRCAVLAVGNDGSLGFAEWPIAVRPPHWFSLDVDAGAQVGEPLAAAVRVVNRGRAILRATVALSATGARVVEGGESTLEVAPQSSAVSYAVIVPSDPGTVLIEASAVVGSGETWAASRTVIAREAPERIVLAAGVAGRGGTEIPVGAQVGARGRLMLAHGRKALLNQAMDALKPPWLTIDGAVWAVLIADRAMEAWSGSDASSRDARLQAGQRIVAGAKAVLAHRSGAAFGQTVGAAPDPRSSALAVLALAAAAPWSPEAEAALPAARDGLMQICFEASETMTDSQRALAAWALAEAGASPDSALPLLAIAVRQSEQGAPVGPERLAIAALAFHALGLEDQAREVAERLARVAEPLAGEEAVPQGVSVFGCGGAMAEAEVTALCALALERVDPKSPSRPTRQWLIQRLAELRAGDQVFGGSSTTGVCSLALLEMMRDAAGGDVRVTMESLGAQTVVDLPPDRWMSVPVGGPDATIRSAGGELVHYVVLAPAGEPRLAGAVASLKPVGDGAVGQVRATATNGGRDALRCVEMRLTLPAGVDAYAPDLEDALATGAIKAYVADGNVLRMLLGDLPAGQAKSVSFRARARRVSRVTESQWGADLVPAGAGQL
jgi:hypothetical protein